MKIRMTVTVDVAPADYEMSYGVSDRETIKEFLIADTREALIEHLSSSLGATYENRVMVS